MAPAAVETASGSIAGAFCSSGSSRNSVRECFGSVAGAFCGSDSSRNSSRERCKSILWLQQQQKQRPGALQECGSSSSRSSVQECIGRVAGAFCGSGSSRNSVWECYRNILWLQQQQKQHPGALQGRSVALAANWRNQESEAARKTTIKRFASLWVITI